MDRPKPFLTGDKAPPTTPSRHIVHTPVHMPEQALPSPRIVLASTSSIRRLILENAGLDVFIDPARIDESALRAALEAEGASPRDLADALAEAKAARVAMRHTDAIVLGAVQVADLDGMVLTKPDTADAAREQLAMLAGRTHRLHAAAVAYLGGVPVWRHVAVARLTMHALSFEEIDRYVAATWPGIGETVGSYKIEAEGLRLFSGIEGDHFTILGLPMIPLLTWLRLRGDIAP
jgi:septum formation protein